MKNLLNVGLVGAGGNMRAKHIPGLLATGEVNLAAVSNRRRQSAERVAREFSIPRVYDHWQELVADDQVDAVVIGTWPNMHAPVTLAALEAGKHVLCEARMARNETEARKMLQAAAKHPEPVKQLVPAPGTLDWDNAVIRLLQEGFAGRVLAIEIRDAGAFIDTDSPLHWRQDRELSGINVMSLGIWYECLLRWGFTAEAVQAAGHTFVDRRADPDTGKSRKVELPDHLEVSAILDNGARAHFKHSAVCGLAPGVGLWLYGDEGTMHIGADGLQGARRGEESLHPIPVDDDEKRGWRVEADFVESIRNDRPVRLTTFEDGVRYMDFTAAAMESLRTGQRVRVKSDPHEQ